MSKVALTLLWYTIATLSKIMERL